MNIIIILRKKFSLYEVYLKIKIFKEKVLYEKEIAIPDEVSVVGFGDYETGELMRPPLTTVKFDWRNWGESSAETMLQMIQQKPVSTIQVNPYEFIERKSVR